MEEKLDVEDSSSSESDDTDVETEESDKDKNFGKLRKIKEDLEKENKELKEKGSDAKTILFDQNKKKAVRKFGSDNKISDEVWEKIKNKITLKGDEDDEEIYQEIQNVYESLPDVKAQKEKELIEKGRTEGLKGFTEEEMDLGTGGEPPTGEKPPVRLTSKDKKWLDVFGVTEEERKKIK